MHKTAYVVCMMLFMMIAGCGGQPAGDNGNNDGNDNQSSPASLVGTWLLEADNGDTQCWEFDDDGNPVRVTSMEGFQSIGLPQLDELIFDGTTRDVDLEGLQATVTSTGNTSMDEDQATVQTDSILALGLVDTTTALDLEGTVEDDTFTGEMTSATSALGMTTEPEITGFTATRDGC